MAALLRRLLAVAVLLHAVAPLDASPAGPLEPDFSGWSRAETAHFVFIYERRDASAVSQLVSFAEEVYAEVTDLLGSHPPRVWVVVAGRVDLANGYTAPAPPHITLYLAPPSEPLIGLEATQYLRLLLAHELSHFINFEYDQGLFAFLSEVFGPAVKDVNASFLPTWFLEGIATDAETLFTDGGRGRNPFFEMEYRALVLSRRFFPLSQAAYSSYYPPADRDWVGGYLFFRFLLDHYGTGIYVRIYDEYTKFPLMGPWSAIERATGRPADALYRDMVQELEARYASKPPVEEGRRVTPDRIGDWFLPVISSRGWYLYRGTLDEAPAIVEYDPAFGREKSLLSTPLTDSVSLTASRDGDAVAFATYTVTRGNSGQVVASDVFSLDPRSGSVRRITTGARAWQPRLSPDGTRLLAVSAVGPCTRLVEIDPRRGSMKLLFAQTDSIVATPDFSPDGTKVAFSVSAGGATSIRVLTFPCPETAVTPADPLSNFNVDQARIVVGPARAGAWYPRFTDSDHLVFSSVSNMTLALLSTDMDGTQARIICEDPVGAWSGEQVGDSVLYATYRPNGFALMTKPLEQKPVDLPADHDAKPLGSAPGSPLISVPYVDVPRFLAWTPLPIYYSTIASQEIVAAPGALFYGLSNLESSSFLGAVSFRTDALQPAVELSLTTALGSLGVGYSLSEGYTNLSRTDHRQELVQQVGMSIPVLSSAELSTTTGLNLSLSVTDVLTARGTRDFTFLEGLELGSGTLGLSGSHDVYLSVGASFLRAAQGSAMDLFPRGEVNASASISAYPPLLSSDGPGAVASGLVSVSMPSPIAHQVIKVGVKASYMGLGGTFYQLTNPRGAFDPVIQSLPARALASVDYQVPIALLDAPLAYSVGLIGIGCGVHLEAAADWAITAGSFSPDRDLYAGAELVLDFCVGEDFFPAGLGIALKFDPRFETPVNWTTDFRPYLFVSTDSFAGTALGATRVETAPLR